jgi:hypothetical protein
MELLLGFVGAFPTLFLFAMVFGALPSLGMITLVRHFALQRPLGDIVSGALSAALCPLMLFVVAGAWSGEWSPNGSMGLLLGVTPIIGLVGALSGFLYWNFAGRPRPPYESG